MEISGMTHSDSGHSPSRPDRTHRLPVPLSRLQTGKPSLILGKRPAWKDFDSAEQKNLVTGLPTVVQSLQTTAEAAQDAAQRNTASINSNHQDIIDLKKVGDHFSYTESSERTISWTDPTFTIEDAAATGRALIEFGNALNNHDAALVSIGGTTLIQNHDEQLQGVRFTPATDETTIRDTYYLGEQTGAGSFAPILQDHDPSNGHPEDSWTISYRQAVIDRNNQNPGQLPTTFPGTGARHSIHLTIGHRVNGSPTVASIFVMGSNEDTKTQTFNIYNSMSSNSYILATYTVTMTRREHEIVVETTLGGYTGLTHYESDLRASFPVDRVVPASPATTERVNLGALGIANPAAFVLFQDTTWKILYRLKPAYR